MASVQSQTVSTQEPGPAWEIARLFPDQGHLSESEYLRLTDHARRFAEYTDGKIEVLPMPTLEHQAIVFYLMTLLTEFVTARKLGKTVIAPYRVRIAERKYREPDVLFIQNSHLAQMANRFAEIADLVMEVVSDDDRQRDLVDKRADYEEAGIPEYWIVDPRTKTITVLRLENGKYVTNSEAVTSGQAHSALLKGFVADATSVFAAGRNA